MVRLKQFTAWVEIKPTKTERRGAWTVGVLSANTKAAAKLAALGEVAQAATESGIGRRRLVAHVEEIKK